jgi:hypothetical protein
MSDEQRQQMRDMREGRESQRRVGSAESGQYQGHSGQYYAPPHYPPYGLPPPPMKMGPPPPPPPPPNQTVGAVYQQPAQPNPGNRHHPALNRFRQDFAHPQPPRFP